MAEGTRERILAAARQQFGKHGYQGTTTREIAAEARVSEPTVFRHFGSKATLFEQAVIDPFARFIEQQMEGWTVRRPGSIPILDETRHFYEDLFDLFGEERNIVPALLAVYRDEVTPSASRRLEQCMRHIIVMLERRSGDEARSRGNVHYDVTTLSRIMVAMAFALGTLPRLFDIQGLARSRVIEEMAQLTAYGAQYRGAPLGRGEEAPAAPTDAHEPTTPLSIPGRLVADDLWATVKPILSPHPRERRPGRQPAADRAVLEGVLHVLTTGIPWVELPQEHFRVSGITCWRRLRQWEASAVWSDALIVIKEAGIQV